MGARWQLGAWRVVGFNAFLERQLMHHDDAYSSLEDALSEFHVSAEAPPVVVRADTLDHPPYFAPLEYASVPRHVVDAVEAMAASLGDPDEDFTDEDETDVEDRT